MGVQKRTITSLSIPQGIVYHQCEVLHIIKTLVLYIINPIVFYAFYVSITNDCDFDGYSTQLMSEHGIDVAFINLNYDFDKCVALLCAN